MGSAGQVLGAQPPECPTALPCVFFQGQVGADREAGSFTFPFGVSKLHRRKVVTREQVWGLVSIFFLIYNVEAVFGCNVWGINKLMFARCSNVETLFYHLLVTVMK